MVAVYIGEGGAQHSLEKKNCFTDFGRRNKLLARHTYTCLKVLRVNTTYVILKKNKELNPASTRCTIWARYYYNVQHMSPIIMLPPMSIIDRLQLIFLFYLSHVCNLSYILHEPLVF
jgi:hypothetical protein